MSTNSCRRCRNLLTHFIRSETFQGRLRSWGKSGRATTIRKILAIGNTDAPRGRKFKPLSRAVVSKSVSITRRYYARRHHISPTRVRFAVKALKLRFRRPRQLPRGAGAIHIFLYTQGASAKPDPDITEQCTNRRIKWFIPCWSLPQDHFDKVHCGFDA